MNTQKFEVVIAGGGFAGVYCAQSLARELGHDSFSRVALIADHNYMVFQPMLAEVVGSSISPQHVVNPIRGICRDVNVLRGGITEIDWPNRRLTVNAGHFTNQVNVEFQHLVLAMGGIVDLSRTPGMPEHAFLMKTVGDALELRGAIIDRFEEANLQPDPEARRRLLTFVIVGGGFSGVETAGEVIDLLQGINRFYPRIAQPDFRVILIHSRAVLLPEVSESLGVYCEKNLRARGVEILLNARVTAMTASKIKLEDGRVIESHTVVSTVGNAPHPLIVDLCKRNNIATEKGRIITEPTMRVPGQQQLWSAGDCAAVPLANSDKEFCAATAQFACRQGSLLGKNIALAIRNPQAAILKPFTFRSLGELAAIGHHSAVAEIFGMKFSGLVAWFMWRTIYLMKLPSFNRKLRVMADWTLDLFFPRDITLLRPRPTEVLQEMHLEKGDQLFHAGEPALSFYIVKKGRIDLLDDNGTVKSLAAGEHFGERALLEDKIWRFTAVAAEPSTLVALDAKVFQAIDSASSSIHRLFGASSQQYVTRQQIEALTAMIPDQVKSLCVADVMTKNLFAMRRDMSVPEAMQLITGHAYNSFPLVDENGMALGLVRQDEFFFALQNGTLTNASTLKNFTPATFASVLPTTPVPDAIERFCRSGRHKLLVVDEGGKLCGILTPVDLMARNGRGM